MKENIKKNLLEMNQKIIDMVIERVKRDLVDDIAIIGLTGSFSTNDFHEKSDLDLIIINDTDKGWELSSCFILDDIGYDIYCSPWAWRIEEQANLESFAVGCLVDLQILYSKDDASLNRLKELQNRALNKLNQPIGRDCLERADKNFNKAKAYYTDMILQTEMNDIRYSSANMLFELINTVVSANNTYIKKGTIRYLEEINGYEHKPLGFEKLYLDVTEAKSIDQIRETSLTIIKTVAEFLVHMKESFIQPNTPTFANLEGVYEELWCNCKNKLIRAASIDNPNYAIQCAKGAEEFLRELHKDIGTKRYELMTYYDPHNMTYLKNRFIEILEDFANEYKKVGRDIKVYQNFDELYKAYMG